jgi:hypothetical protein
MPQPERSVTSDSLNRYAPAEVASPDPIALLDDVPLTENEAGYFKAARAENTLRGYRSDWSEFTT